MEIGNHLRQNLNRDKTKQVSIKIEVARSARFALQKQSLRRLRFCQHVGAALVGLLFFHSFDWHILQSSNELSKNKAQRRPTQASYNIKSFLIMQGIIKVWLAALLLVFHLIGTYGAAQEDTFSKTDGQFSHTGSNQTANTFTDYRSTQRQVADSTYSRPNALLVDIRNLRSDDVTPADATNINAFSNDGFQSFRSKDDHVESSDQDPGVFKQTKDVLETAEIAYFVHPEPDHQLQNEEQPEPSDTGQQRRILSPGQGFCTNPTTMFNLFNTAVLAEQSGFHPYHSQNALTGCDGEIFNINRVTFDPTTWSQVASVGGPGFWKATFSQQTSIKTILLINRGEYNPGWLLQFTATVGNNTDVTLNPVCVPLGAIPDGGWNMCQNSLIGTTFGVYSSIDNLDFVDVMAYSLEVIHMNAGITMSFLGTNNPTYPVSNVIQRQVVLNTVSSRQKCVLIQPPAGDLARFSIKFKAQTLIKVVTLIPGYETISSSWTTHQTNVEIYGKTVGGTQQLCGVLADYYARYSEAPCNIQANEIILVQQNALYNLEFCGFGALADCNCNQSSFNPLLFTTTPTIPFASAISISVSSADSVQQIQFNIQAPDTVSSVCGNGDGTSKCGTRQLSFKDKMTGLEIYQWPYKGYNFDFITSKLTLDPAQAYATSVLTATISLQNYPNTSMSQDITAAVQGGFLPPADPVPVVAPVFAQAPPSQQMALNAIINQQASLQLPTLDASYVYSMLSKPTFSALIDGTQLLVFSTNENDVGTKYLDIVATSPTNKVNFKVKVIFISTLSSATTTTSSVQASASTNPSEVSQSSENSSQSQSELITQLEKVECDSQGECFDPLNSRFSCFFDEEAGKFVCGVDLEKKNKATAKNQVQRSPVMTVSQVSRKGILIFSFNQPMDFSSLENKTYSEVKAQKKSKNQTSSIDLSRYKYLLSNEHLKIEILPDQDQDASKLEFEWFASDITETNITIQFLFQHPTYISWLNNTNYLKVKFLPGFLVVKARQSQMNMMNALRTEKRIVPPQVILGKVTDNVEAASETLKNVCEAGVLGNFFFSAVMKAAMGSMYTMIHTFQMTMVYSLMIVAMPGNVDLVMTQMHTVASFDYLPSDKIMKFCFEFSKTAMPLVAFQRFGALSFRLTLYLATFFIAVAGVCLLSFLYVINLPFTRKFKLSFRYKRMMEKTYYWSGIIRLTIESYWDLCIGILFSWQEPRFDTPSDICDFVLTLFFTLVVVAGPLTFFLLLSKNADKLNNEQFKFKFGSLTEGLKTSGLLGSASAKKMIVWFFVRRFLTALVLMFLGGSSPIFQIALIMYLALYDVSMNFHLNAYESYLNDIVQKINNIIVWLISFFPFLYAGIIQDTQLIYKIGWVQCSLVGIMVFINISVIIFEMIINTMETIRRGRVERYNLRMVKKYNKNFKVLVQSRQQTLSRLLRIEWALFDGVPARINEQITPQVKILRFEIEWGYLNKIPREAQIDLDIELFEIQQAEILGDQIDEFELVGIFNAEDQVDQLDELSFNANQTEERKISSDNEQVVSNKQTKVVAKERIPISSQQVSREVQADEIVEEVVQNAQRCMKVELRRQTEETKSRPTQVTGDDWETDLWKESDQPRVANKNESAQKIVINNKVIPAKQGALKPALLQRKQKLIVQEAKDQQKLLKKQKEEIFDQVVNKIIKDRDPMASFQSVYDEARELAHLLSNEISKMSLKEQETEVNAIIQSCPEYVQNQKKLDEHKYEVAHLNRKEYFLQDEIRDKVLEIDELRNLSKFQKDKVYQVPEHLRYQAIQDLKETNELVNQKEIELQYDYDQVKHLAAEKKHHQEWVKHLSRI